MSDDERDDDDAPADPEPRRPKKKKKRRAAIAAARAAAAAEVAAPASPSWTTAHLAAALAAGLALGGLGGYGVWGRGDASSPGPVGKDSAPQASGRGASASSARLQQPTPDPGVPVYVPIAAWSPREGPEHAKVTILEFSDFQ